MTGILTAMQEKTPSKKQKSVSWMETCIPKINQHLFTNKNGTGVFLILIKSCRPGGKNGRT